VLAQHLRVRDSVSEDLEQSDTANEFVNLIRREACKKGFRQGPSMERDFPVYLKVDAEIILAIHLRDTH
jgi:hypothetical protein